MTFKKLIPLFALCCTFNFVLAQNETDLASLVSDTYEVSISHGTVDFVSATVKVEKIDNNKIRISSKGETSYELEIKQFTEKKIGGGDFNNQDIYFEDYLSDVNRVAIGGHYTKTINGGQPWSFTGSRPGSLMHPPIITPQFIEDINVVYIDDPSKGIQTLEADNTIRLRFFEDMIRMHARKLKPPPDEAFTNLINTIINSKKERADATENLADSIFMKSGFKKYDGKLDGGQGFDGLYSYENLNTAYVVECKQWSEKPSGNNQWDYFIGLNKANPETGLPAQMTDGWIIDVKERLKARNDNQEAVNFLGAKTKYDYVKLIMAVDRKTREIYVLKIDEDKKTKEEEKKARTEEEARRKKEEEEKAEKAKKIENAKEKIESVKGSRGVKIK